jgi:hypothetical protein
MSSRSITSFESSGVHRSSAASRLSSTLTSAAICEMACGVRRGEDGVGGLNRGRGEGAAGRAGVVPQEETRIWSRWVPPPRAPPHLAQVVSPLRILIHRPHPHPNERGLDVESLSNKILFITLHSSTVECIALPRASRWCP